MVGLLGAGLKQLLGAIENVLHLNLPSSTLQLLQLSEFGRQEVLCLVQVVDLGFELIHETQQLGHVLLVAHHVPCLVELLPFSPLNCFIDQFLVLEFFLN